MITIIFAYLSLKSVVFSYNVQCSTPFLTKKYGIFFLILLEKLFIMCCHDKVFIDIKYRFKNEIIYNNIMNATRDCMCYLLQVKMKGGMKKKKNERKKCENKKTPIMIAL